MFKTSSLRILKYILCFLVFGCVNNAIGQVNLKVGYSMNYTNLEQTKSIFDRFNDLNPQAEKQLTPVKFYHGVELGLRYRLKHIGIDFGLSSASGSTEALNVFQEDGSLGNDDWKMSLINYSVGLENYYGTFGYGASIGTQKLKFRTNFVNSSGKRTILDESVLSSKFYLIIEVPSKSVSFSIRPYIATTWKPYNIRDVELTINPQSTLPASDFEQDVVIYGFSFLFYNGPQNRY